MTNTIKILNNNTFVEIDSIANVLNPVVYEEINGSYTFSFDVDYREKQHLVYPNIISVEDEYFRVSRTLKSRSDSIKVTIDCEHVSYALIKEDDEIEEYDDTAAGMLASLLNGTRFSVGTVIATSTRYYKPSSTSIRGRLFDIANLFGGELVFEQFTVHLVERRGTDNGLEFKLGENLVGVTEEIDTSEGYPIASYEVDVVDLSKLPGYGYLATVNLGDGISVIDPMLEINVSYRVLSRERNPFQKINPRVQIGNLIRDFTDYVREDKEEKEEEDPTINYFLQ